jgi:hypothetical protein
MQADIEIVPNNVNGRIVEREGARRDADLRDPASAARRCDA